MTTKRTENRTRVRLYNGGANRGAVGNLAAFRRFNETSTSSEIVPIYVDPVPGRAAALAERARTEGLDAEAIEGVIEGVPSDSTTKVPRILNLDRASAITTVLRAEAENGNPMLIYLLLKMGNRRLFGIRAVLQSMEASCWQQATALFGGIAQVSERAGSSGILGVDANPFHARLEPALREWFAAHTSRELGKFTAGLEPESAPIEVTEDGEHTRPLLVVERSTWGEPREVLAQAIAKPGTPIRRGAAFSVAEVTPAGLRFHDARSKTHSGHIVHQSTLDDRALERLFATAERDESTALALVSRTSPASAAPTRAEGTTLVTASPEPTTGEGSERFLQAIAEILEARVRTDTVTMRNPVVTTD